MKACVLTGRERHRFVRGNIQRFRSAERPQLEWRATPVRARGPSPLFSLSNSPLLILLSFSFSPAGCGRASQPPSLPPLPPPVSPPPLPSKPTHPPTHSRIQASSAQPCVVISGNSFRMLPVHCVHSFLSLSLSILYLSLHPVHPHHRLCVSSFTIRCKGTMPDLLCRHFLILLSRLYMFSWHLYPQVAPDLK